MATGGAVSGQKMPKPHAPMYPKARWFRLSVVLGQGTPADRMPASNWHGANFAGYAACQTWFRILAAKDRLVLRQEPAVVFCHHLRPG